MIRFSHIRLPLAALVAWGMGGCPEPVERVSWDPIDPDAVRAAIESPTGTLGPETVKSALVFVAEILVFLDAVVFATDAIGGSGKEGETVEGELSTVSGPLATGTNVYLKISCPGPDTSVPDLRFGHGHLRLDSSSLTDAGAGLASLDFDGHGLLSFVECIIGDWVFAGANPLFIGGDTGEIAIGVSMTATGEESLDLALDLLLDGAGVSFVFIDDLGESIAVVYHAEPEATVLQILGANDTFNCSVVPEGVQCVDSAGDPLSLGDLGVF